MTEVVRGSITSRDKLKNATITSMYSVTALDYYSFKKSRFDLFLENCNF